MTVDKENFKIHLGEIIRIYRKREGVTQEELAKLIGVSSVTLGNYENGQALCKAVGMSLPIFSDFTIADVLIIRVLKQTVKYIFYIMLLKSKKEDMFWYSLKAVIALL